MVQDTVHPLSEDDLALIHALQLQPRASWSVLGRALGVDPVTVARRWSRLTRRGEAWVGVSPGPRLFEQVCAAFIEIDCALGSATAVARTLGGHPHVLTLARMAGGHDILATVATRDPPAMSHYTLDRLPAIPGVTAVRARDYPVIMGAALIIGAFVIVLNLLTDLAYAVIDPRIEVG